MSEKESLKELVLRMEKEGRLVYTNIEGFTSVDLDALIDHQPLVGLLYDLNRLPETIFTFLDEPDYGVKWVNDYAVYLVIKRLHERLKSKLNPCWKFAAKLYKQKYRNRKTKIDNQRKRLDKLDKSIVGVRLYNTRLKKQLIAKEKELVELKSKLDNKGE